MGPVLRWWMGGRAACMLVVGILMGIGLFVAGVPFFLSLRVIAGPFLFVPFMGPIAATIPAILVAFRGSP